MKTGKNAIAPKIQTHSAPACNKGTLRRNITSANPQQEETYRIPRQVRREIREESERHEQQGLKRWMIVGQRAVANAHIGRELRWVWNSARSSYRLPAMPVRTIFPAE